MTLPIQSLHRGGVQVALLAAAELPREYPLTIVALILVAANGLHRRSGTALRANKLCVARRLQWHWPAYVASYEAARGILWVLGCHMPTSQQDVINNIVITAATAATALPLVGILSSAIELSASRSAWPKVPPLPVMAAFLSVALNWSLILYILGAGGNTLRYVPG